MNLLSLFWLLINLALATQGFATVSCQQATEIPLQLQNSDNLRDDDSSSSSTVQSIIQKTKKRATSDETSPPIERTRRIAYLFFNPGAGQGDPDEELEKIYATLEPAVSVRLLETKPDIDIQKQCQELVQTINKSDKENAIPPMVVASGGDGTVSAVAQAVMNTGIPFGVIPRGTANAFATALGIPTESIEAACANLLTGTPRLVDAATCDKDGQAMILLAGIGWEANMVKTAQGTLKRWFGPLAYIWGGVKETIQPNSFKCRLRVDGSKRTRVVKTHAITVAVTAPGGSVSAQGTGEVIPDDGLLDITIQTCEDSFLKSLDAMAHLLKAAVVKEPTETDNIMHLRAKTVEITCRSKQRVVVDGELHPKGKKRFTYSVLENALNVITPPVTVPEQQIQQEQADARLTQQ